MAGAGDVNNDGYDDVIIGAPWGMVDGFFEWCVSYIVFGGARNALFLSAFAALHDPDSRAYYDRKRSQGKKHNAALICLARRRTDDIYAMLRDGTCYQPKTPAAS